MIFISAGHHKNDPGASAYGRTEAQETIKIRTAVENALKCKYPKYRFITDDDRETLSQYLKRIKTGEGSVVLEFHLDASGRGASGSTTIISSTPTINSRKFASELVNRTSSVLGIPNRGVITESESARGRLGLMRESGTVCLLEVCFIDNKSDMKALDKNLHALSYEIADLLVKYEDLI